MKRNHSRGDHLDLYQQVRRNRLKLAFSFSLYFAAAMAFSGVVIFLVFSRLPFPSLYFWIALVLFWTSFFLYCLLRYALGGQWVLKKVKTLPTHRRDRRLDNALASVLLASGMRAKVRLKEIPHSDINAFSLSLPDGSFLLFSTRGVAEKLSASEREAVMAHEVAHMQAGDALLHTALLRLAGTRNMASLPGGWKPGKTRTRWTETSIPPVFLLVFLALLLASMLGEIPIDSVFYPLLSMAALFWPWFRFFLFFSENPCNSSWTVRENTPPIFRLFSTRVIPPPCTMRSRKRRKTCGTFFSSLPALTPYSSTPWWTSSLTDPFVPNPPCSNAWKG
jgi:Zn-dependent protease with chaperone function